MRIIDRLNIGGPAIHAVVTSKGLDRTRFRTVLVIGSIEASEGDMAYLLEEAGVEEVVRIPSLGREMRVLRDLSTLWQVVRLMLRERPQVVHTHKAKAGAIGRAAALLCRVPVRVHTFHGHVLRGYFGPAKTRVYQTLEKLLARPSSRLVVPSRRLADELAGEFQVADRAHFEVIPLGFDLEPFARADGHRGQLRRELGGRPPTCLWWESWAAWCRSRTTAPSSRPRPCWPRAAPTPSSCSWGPASSRRRCAPTSIAGA